MGSVATKSFYTITFKKLPIILLCLLLEMIILYHCRSAQQESSSIGFSTPGIKQVAVLSFRNMTEIYGEKTSLINPISGKVFVTGKIEQSAKSLLTRLLISRISNIESYQLLPPEQAEGILSSIYEEDAKGQDERHKIMQIGRQIGADVVLVGYIYRFKDRVGGKYAVDTPASVAFDLNMISTHDGALIWSGHFDETQQSLNENLFLLSDFLKRGGVWVTAEQMAAAGLDDLVMNMPISCLKP